MDVPRQASDLRKRRIRRIGYAVAGVAAILAITLGVSRLKPAPPSVDRAAVWVDTVKQGTMLRQVRGLGTLVPVEIRWIPAATEGRVERILVLPGSQVKANTVLLQLSNPQLRQEETDARYQLQAAEAEYRQLQASLHSAVLDQKATAAAVSADYREALAQSKSDADLVQKGLVARLDADVSRQKALGLEQRTELEQQRIAAAQSSMAAQLAAQQAKVAQLRAQYELKQSQVADLQVKAGINGVLQDLPLQVGQWVTSGTTMAKVAQPQQLKAQIKVAETEARDVQLGQPASIDTHNGVIPGHVIRIDPAVQNGTVTVDVALDGALPSGARPDLSVDGTINIEKLSNVLYVGRPAFGQADSTVTMYKLAGDGKDAVAVKVELGKTSVNTVQILRGLNVGDQVILSDMSAQDGADRIRLQ
jgi:HlyD family secretion protein